MKELQNSEQFTSTIDAFNGPIALFLKGVHLKKSVVQELAIDQNFD